MNPSSAWPPSRCENTPAIRPGRACESRAAAPHLLAHHARLELLREVLALEELQCGDVRALQHLGVLGRQRDQREPVPLERGGHRAARAAPGGTQRPLQLGELHVRRNVVVTPLPLAAHMIVCVWAQPLTSRYAPARRRAYLLPDSPWLAHTPAPAPALPVYPHKRNRL